MPRTANQAPAQLRVHPEDWDQARDFNRAAYFTAFLQNGTAKYRERDLPTYGAARLAADKLEAAHATHGRKAMVYAVIMPANYSILCTPQVLWCAGQLRRVGRERIANLATADGEVMFANEVLAGCWDHRSDVAEAIAKAEPRK